MIIEKLRQSTSEIHKELDSWLMPVFKQVDEIGKYEALLTAFYEYYAPVMEKISEEIDTHYLPDFAHRRRPDSILIDLAAIDKPAGKINFATVLPTIKNPSEAFGAMYVLEGSTLGGIFLSKMLAENMQLDEQKGLSFFYGYGKQSKERWNIFIEQINHFAKQKGDEAAIVSSANDTFRCLKNHLQQKLQYN